MPTIHDLKQSAYLTQHDCEPPILVTITGWQNVTKDLDSDVPRYAITFAETEKPLVLNSTNGQIIAAVAGDEDFANWNGVKIVLYRDPNISFGGKVTGGIRARAPKVKTAPVAAPPPPQEEYSVDDADLPF